MTPQQSIDGDKHPQDSLLLNQRHLEQLVQDMLPTDEICYCFGYGSGVFSQQLQQDAMTITTTESNLVDLIVVVRSAFDFHEQNYARNPHHYWTPPRWIRNARQKGDNDNAFMAHWCTAWQRDQPSSRSIWGQNPGLYFFVTDTVKYGVVQTDDLCRDLQDWTHLYLAGRLHKPTLPLYIHSKGKDDNDIHGATRQSIERLQQDVNLPAALSAALLFLSQSNQNNDNNNKPRDDLSVVSELDVYRAISELSYRGDFRMQVGAEDPLKITRLVQSPGQLQRFRSLYQPILQRWQSEHDLELEVTAPYSDDNNKQDKTEATHTWTWDVQSEKTQQLLWSQIPLSLQHSPNSTELLSRQIAGRVASAARYQSVKGIVTAGPRRAAQYAARKLSKGVLKFLK